MWTVTNDDRGRTITVLHSAARQAERLLREHRDGAIYLTVDVRDLLRLIARPDEIADISPPEY